MDVHTALPHTGRSVCIYDPLVTKAVGHLAIKNEDGSISVSIGNSQRLRSLRAGQSVIPHVAGIVRNSESFTNRMTNVVDAFRVRVMPLEHSVEVGEPVDLVMPEGVDPLDGGLFVPRLEKSNQLNLHTEADVNYPLLQINGARWVANMGSPSLNIIAETIMEVLLDTRVGPEKDKELYEQLQRLSRSLGHSEHTFTGVVANLFFAAGARRLQKIVSLAARATRNQRIGLFQKAIVEDDSDRGATIVQLKLC